MSIDIKTAQIKPRRTTFEHIEAKLGKGRAPNRYQEVMFGLQHEEVFHYRPTWDPEREIFDADRTAINMADYEDLLDPRQYYYGTYVMRRAKQQEAMEKHFAIVERRGLLEGIDGTLREKITRVVVPFRHVEWGANANNLFIAAYGFGTPIAVAADFQGMDRLGNAQYLSRIGLALSNNDPAILDQAKSQWLQDPLWQPLRKLVEDSFVVQDWFELHVLQNCLLDGLLHPLLFQRFDAEVAAGGGAAFVMLTEFFTEWFAESARWTDAVIKVAADESAANRALLSSWVARWAPAARVAAAPLADFLFGARGPEILGQLAAELEARNIKAGAVAGADA